LPSLGSNDIHFKRALPENRNKTKKEGSSFLRVAKATGALNAGGFCRFFLPMVRFSLGGLRAFHIVHFFWVNTSGNPHEVLFCHGGKVPE